MPTLSRLTPLALAVTLTTLYACAAQRPQATSQAHVESFLESATDDFEGTPGVAQLTFNGIAMACISDVAHNRMRLIAPVAERSSLSKVHLDNMLLANYHSALDARYAISDGIV